MNRIQVLFLSSYVPHSSFDGARPPGTGPGACRCRVSRMGPRRSFGWMRSIGLYGASWVFDFEGGRVGPLWTRVGWTRIEPFPRNGPRRAPLLALGPPGASMLGRHRRRPRPVLRRIGAFSSFEETCCVSSCSVARAGPASFRRLGFACSRARQRVCTRVSEVPPTIPSREPGGRKAAVLEAARDREAPPHGGRPDPPAYGMERAK